MEKRIVRSTDFSDELIRDFFDAMDRLEPRFIRDVPDWVRKAAEEFAATLPKPEPDELRQHIEHAVTVARGWDDPDDPQVMFHTAVKAYYTLKWFEFIHHHAEKMQKEPGTMLLVDTTFAPHFYRERPI